MREGINLATRPFRARRRLLAAVLGAGLLATAVHATRWRAARAEVERLRGVVAEEDARAAAAEAELARLRARIDEPALRRAAAYARAVRGSGALAGPGPSELLRLVAKAMPPEARVVSLRASLATNEPSVEMSVRADRSAAVGELVARLDGTPWVRRARLLDERGRGEAGGAIDATIRVELRAEALP